MSHVAVVNIEIKDLECVRLACEELGLDFREAQKTFKWFGQWVNDYDASDAAYKAGISTKDYGKCDHAIAVKGNPKAYEIGLVKSKDGEGYKMLWDFYAGGYGLQEKVGKNCSNFVAAYTKQVARKAVKAAAKKYGFGGYSETKDEATGEIKIRITKF